MKKERQKDALLERDPPYSINGGIRKLFGFSKEEEISKLANSFRLDGVRSRPAMTSSIDFVPFHGPNAHCEVSCETSSKKRRNVMTHIVAAGDDKRDVEPGAVRMKCRKHIPQP